MLTAEEQHFICPLNMGYIPYQRVIIAFKGIFLPEKRVLQDMICCPYAVNECPFKRTFYLIFGKECLVFGNFICCLFRIKCLAPYTVPLGPMPAVLLSASVERFFVSRMRDFFMDKVRFDFLLDNIKIDNKLN